MLNRTATQAIQIYQVARFGALLLASILLSKSGMDTAGIGSYETCMLIAGTFSFFWINGLTHTYLSQYRKSEDKAKTNAALFWSVVSISVLLFLLLAAARPAIEGLFRIDLSGSAYGLFLLFFLVNNLSFLTDYFLLAQDNGKGLMRLSIFQLIVQTALISIPAFIFQDFTSALAGATLFATIKTLISLYLAYNGAAFRTDPAHVQVFVRSSGPMILSFFLGGMAIYVDGIIVSNFYDKATFATYQYGAREFPLSLLLANAFSAAMVAHISAQPADTEAVRRGSLQLIQRLFPVVILLAGVSYWLYPLVYNPQFQISYVYFNIYLLLIISRLVFPNSILLGLGHSRIIMRAAIVEFVLNITVSLLLLQWIGLQGVAYGTVIANFFNKGMLAYQLHTLGVSPRQYIPVKALIMYGSILVIVFITFTYLIHS